MVVSAHLKQHPAASSRLRKLGLHLTPQRKIIAEVLQQAGEGLDAPEVLRRARPHQATVYRALESRNRLGITDKLDLMHVNGPGHYDEAHTGEDHLYFTCWRRGAALEIRPPPSERLKGQIEVR